MSMYLDVIRLFRGWRMRQAHAEMIDQEDDEGCIACGSQNVEIRDDKRICSECGYVGRADGGGILDSDMINDALYTPDL